MTQEIFYDSTNSDSLLTPLHKAVLKRDLGLINKLIDKGADLHAKDQYGNTPLDLAKKNAETNPDAGSSVYKTTKFGNTDTIVTDETQYAHNMIIRDLEYAIKNKKHEDEKNQVQSLIESGDTTAQDQLQLAFNSKNPKLLRYLVEKGARLDVKDKQEKTILDDYLDSYMPLFKKVLSAAYANAEAGGINAHTKYALDTEFNYAKISIMSIPGFSEINDELIKMNQEKKFSGQFSVIKIINSIGYMRDPKALMNKLKSMPEPKPSTITASTSFVSNTSSSSSTLGYKKQ